MTLDQRLRDAAAGVKEATRHLVPPPIETLGRAPRRPTPVPAGRPLVAAAAAFLAALLVVGAAGLVLRSDGSRIVDQPMTTAPPAPPPLPSLQWSRVPHDETVFGGVGQQQILSVAAGGPGLVAVGVSGPGVGEFSGNRDAAVWTSPDGLTWSRAPHDDDVFGGPGSQEVSSVTAGGPGLVAVGHRFDEPDRPGVYPAVWTSVDGISWMRVADDGPAFSEGGSMSSVTRGGPGLVAVGTDSWSAAVWTSGDGINWSRVPHDPVVFGVGIAAGDTGQQTTMSDVTVGGPGLVAVGSASSGAWSESSDGINWTHEPGAASAVVWTSLDGVTWTRTPDDPAVFGGEGHHRMSAVTPGGPGLVAVGSYELFTVESDTADGLVSSSDRAVVWTSPDGITWMRIPHDEVVFGGEAMSGVVSNGPDIVAVGGGAWTSLNGVTWRREPTPPGSGLRDITTGGPGLVAVGTAATETQADHAAVFVAAEER